jgi:D-alanyl-lipoteichoic acid acyltransferase DltB (MBOAT superfamily)
MTLAIILVFTVLGGLYGWLVKSRGRVMLLLVVSALAVYGLQPTLPVRGLDFWLPTATLFLAVCGWFLTTPADQRGWRANWPAAAILAVTVLALGLTRFLGFSLPLTASRPPQTLQIFIALCVAALFFFILTGLIKAAKILLLLAPLAIIVIFVILKVPGLAVWVSMQLRGLNGQSPATATALDLRWLGFSYLAFRLLHTFRDRQLGRLPDVTLAEYVVYVIFFPALTAGPIDRIERFVSDLRRPPALSAGVWTDAGRRLLVGCFKKFVLADTLALIALNGANAVQVRATGWMWVLLYAYTFQIYLDFSGYTDIAIGLGRLMGFKLPENFASPYLKPNLTQFWNSWHMTLTQWFRAYFFNPLTRTLRLTKKPLPVPAVIFITQLATMLLIGLWHGMTANFVLWGLWHGLGLFVHNRWSDLTRARFAALPASGQRVLNAGGVILTFNFVALGWIFFALPTPSVSLHVFTRLFGLF